MLSQDITNLATHLGEMAVHSPEHIAERIDLIRASLFDIASQVRQLEVHFIPSTVSEGAVREHNHS